MLEIHESRRVYKVGTWFVRGTPGVLYEWRLWRWVRLFSSPYSLPEIAGASTGCPRENKGSSSQPRGKSGGRREEVKHERMIIAIIIWHLGSRFTAAILAPLRGSMNTWFFCEILREFKSRMFFFFRIGKKEEKDFLLFANESWWKVGLICKMKGFVEES